jgi:hypothetical protein
MALGAPPTALLNVRGESREQSYTPSPNLDRSVRGEFLETSLQFGG